MAKDPDQIDDSPEARQDAQRYGLPADYYTTNGVPNTLAGRKAAIAAGLKNGSLRYVQTPDGKYTVEPVTGVAPLDLTTPAASAPAAALAQAPQTAALAPSAAPVQPPGQPAPQAAPQGAPQAAQPGAPGPAPTIDMMQLMTAMSQSGMKPEDAKALIDRLEGVRQFSADMTGKAADFLTTTRKEGADAIGRDAEAQKLEAKQYQAAAEETQRLATQYQTKVDERAAQRIQLQNQIQGMQQYANELAANPIHDAWAEASTPLKIGALIAMGLGSGIQAIYHDKSNVVADQIDSRLKQDLAMQRLRQEQAQKGLENQRSLVGDMRNLFDDSQTADAAAYVTGLQAIKARVEFMSKASSDPRIQANSQRLMAAMDEKIAPMMDVVAQQGIGQQISLLNQETVLAGKLGSSQSAKEALSLGRLEQGQQRLDEKIKQDQIKNGIQQETVSVPGYDDKTLTPKDATSMKAAQAFAQKMDNALAMLEAEVSKGRVNALSSWNGWALLKSAQAATILKAKSAAGDALGARFTEAQQALESAKYGTDVKGVLINPQAVIAVIRRQREIMRKELSQSAFNAGLKHPNQENPFFKPQ